MIVFLPAMIMLLAAGAFAKISTEYKTLILDYHTQVRKSRHASNMHKLEWDDKLATIADSWLAGCRFDHENAGYGENLAFDDAKDGKNFTKQINTAMESWFNESYDFNRAGGQQPCGYTASCHYTQMSWSSTRLIGCAYRVCDRFDIPGSRPENNIFYFGCWYDPKGNWVEKGKMVPFKKGPAGSECEEGEENEDGLCKGIPKCKDRDGDDCLMYKAQGNCENNKPYMDIHCAKTCGVCKDESGVVEKEDCKDTRTNCGVYVTDVVRKYKSRMYTICVTALMFKECRKTCGFCDLDWDDAQKLYQ